MPVQQPDDLDPLDIDQAFATRRSMSQGNKVRLSQLVAGRSGLFEKSNILLRYLKCRFGPGNLSPEEFLKFGLVDGAIAAPSRFVGHDAQQKMHDACNDKSWFATCKNKLLWETILRGASLPVPETLAVYEAKGRGAGVPVLCDENALVEFLSQSSNLPVFCKPVTGVYSIGAFRIDGFDGKWVTINGNWKKPVSTLIHYFKTIGKKGYLLQRPLKANGELSQITGTSVATLRILLKLDGGVPSAMRCVLKLPAKGAVADNFWRRDAQLVSIDMKSGRVKQKITNDNSAIAATKPVDPVAFPPLGFELPDFQESVALACQASRHFPGIRTQSWDVAMSDNGPVLMELNFGGDLGLVQMAHGEGILNDEYCDHLRKCGYGGKLPF